MGSLEVICGPMFSGKTEELIRRLKRAVIARRKVQIFKPRIDTRYEAEAVVSHSAQRLRSIVIDRAEEIHQRLLPDTEVVGIDEVQFLGPEVALVCQRLADAGKRVIVAGLDLDYRGVPFDPMPTLLAMAEQITKEHAICVVCGEPATRSQRTTAAEDRVLVGAAGQYEPRCRGCFSAEPRPATELPEQALLPFLRD
jgi:thymidine kinase